MVVDGRDGSVRKMKMKVVGTVKNLKMEMADTYYEEVENGFVGGHSTFDTRFSGRMNLQL